VVVGKFSYADHNNSLLPSSTYQFYAPT